MKPPTKLKMKEKLKHYQIFWGLILGVIFLDQLTKYLVQLSLPAHPNQVLATVSGWLSFVYVQNTGAAWGVMSGSGYILGALAIVALVAIYMLRKALQLKRVPMQIAFGLLAAGIVGNMIDRLCLGYVVDFIDCTFGTFRFPAFNIADMGISVGVVLYIIYSSIDGIVPQKKEIKAEAR